MIKTKVGLNFNKKDYTKKYNQEYFKSENGVLRRLYHHIKERTIKNNWFYLGLFSFEEFKNWAYKNNFKNYYNTWKDNNFSKNMKPSIDRIDDIKNYNLKNIRIVTWSYNWQRGINSKKNIEAYKKCLNSFTGEHKRKVMCVESQKIYDSILECAKDIKGQTSKICNVCKGIRKHHLGLTFIYVDGEGVNVSND